MHHSRLHEVVKHGEFSLTFVAERGEIIHVPSCVCTSWHSAGATMNIKVCASGQVRKINRYTIIEINGKKLYLTANPYLNPRGTVRGQKAIL